MQTHRFFVKPDSAGQTAVFDSADSQHAIKVLRLKKGDVVSVKAPDGEYQLKILKIS